jgi:hypothetical protein
MTKIKIFKHDLSGSARTMTDERGTMTNERGEISFVGKDVAKALGFSTTTPTKKQKNSHQLPPKSEKLPPKSRKKGKLPPKLPPTPTRERFTSPGFFVSVPLPPETSRGDRTSLPAR